jgi:hypothetical protein
MFFGQILSNRFPVDLRNSMYVVAVAAVVVTKRSKHGNLRLVLNHAKFRSACLIFLHVTSQTTQTRYKNANISYLTVTLQNLVQNTVRSHSETFSLKSQILYLLRYLCLNCCNCFTMVCLQQQRLCLHSGHNDSILPYTNNSGVLCQTMGKSRV